MKILLVHNAYRSATPSGENQVVASQVELLRNAGFDVATYFRSSDEISDLSWVRRMELAARPTYSFEDVVAFGRQLDEFQPDVVHVHNVYPLISPAIIRVARRRGYPVVQTVHNYRHVCVAGTFFAGHVCEECSDRAIPWPAVKYGCYRDSRLQSVAMSAAITGNRKTLQLLARLLPVSEFVADFLAHIGIDRDRITTVPNAVPDPGPPSPVGRGFFFAGMLTRYKGVHLLLDSWKRSGLGRTTSLTIVGDGPERSVVEHAATDDPGVRFEGIVPPGRVLELMANSRVVVVPSLCYEALPTVVLEAFACGRPVLASEIGAFASLVTPNMGWLAQPSVEPFSVALQTAYADAQIDQLGTAARRRYEEAFTPAAVLRQLTNVYAAVSQHGPGATS